ncbi:MAG: phosphotransferase [Micropruina sp.]|nr:phosphotransferase [Micropruina sp.]
MPDVQLGRELPAALFAWLPGPNLGWSPRPDQVRALGRAMATLHDHSAGWRLPEGCDLPSIDTVLMNVPHRMHTDHPLLTDERRPVLVAAFDQVQRHYHAFFADAPRQVLHADLHGGNAKWHRGRLSVFDFDDAGIGVPLQDLAISAYYLRDRIDLEAELLAGYAEVRPLPTFSAEQYEAVVASRNLVLVNDTIGSSHAGVRDGAELYVANSVVKLRKYLQTGRFAHDADGVLPAR